MHGDENTQAVRTTKQNVPVPPQEAIQHLLTPLIKEATTAHTTVVVLGIIGKVTETIEKTGYRITAITHPVHDNGYDEPSFLDVLVCLTVHVVALNDATVLDVLMQR